MVLRIVPVCLLLGMALSSLSSLLDALAFLEVEAVGALVLGFLLEDPEALSIPVVAV